MGGGLQKGCKCNCPGDNLNDMEHNVQPYPGPTSYVTRHVLDGGGQDRGKGPLCMDRWCCPEMASGQVVVPMQTPSLSLQGDQQQAYPMQKEPPMSYPSQNNQQYGQDALQAMMGQDAGPVPAPNFDGGDARENSHRSQTNSDRGGKTASEWADDQSQFSHLPPLPPGWLRVLSKSTGKIYYCYPETGETTFTEPTGPPPSVKASEQLPPGWTQMISRSTGRVYYWHAELQKSQFEVPTEADSVPAAAPPQAARPAAAALPAPWTEMQSRSSGRTYYYNTETQVSQFDRPK